MNPVRARKALAVAALFTWSASGSALAQNGPSDVLTPWTAAQIGAVRTAVISPDGGHVAYTISLPRKPWEEEDGRARSELHVLNVESGETRAFVTAESGTSVVRWSPDGKHLTFLAKREGDDQKSLYMLALSGGEARRAIQLEDRGIGTYEFAPDGSRVALLATAPEGKDREKEKKKGFKQEVYEEDWRPGEVWIATPFDDDAEPKAVPVEGHVSALEWDPAGKRLALAVAPTALVDDSYVRKRVRIVDVETGEVTVNVENGGKLDSVEWSPDGNSLVLIAGRDEHDGAANRLLFADLSGGGTVKPVATLGERESDEHQAVWLPDGRLIVRGSAGAWSTLSAVALNDGAVSRAERLLPLEGPVFTSVSLSKDGTRAALVGSTPEHPSELFTLDVASKTLTRRTNSNPWLGEMRFGRQEVIRYPARDGLEIEGILIHPLDGQKPAPLVVCVHGGPESHLSNGWMTRYSYMGQIGSALGYAVFYPNYRGSTGRGLAYLKQSQGDPAGKEFDDVVDGVDYLIEQGIADKDKVGVTGGSYGGYATAWFSTYYSDRFAAGVMFVGISNKISKVGTTDIADEEFYVHAMKRPWDDWQFFLERSPIYYADRGKTPLLILHGKDDTRVDPGQSREMYRHLKLRGKAPVRLVNYPGEGHGNRKAGAQFDYNLRMLRWFDHYLKGEGGDPPAHPIDYAAHVPEAEETSEGP